jgi:hypothetical protein
MGAGIVMVSFPVIVWSPMEPSWYAAILSRTLVSVWLIGGCLSFAALARGLCPPYKLETSWRSVR